MGLGFRVKGLGLRVWRDWHSRCTASARSFVMLNQTLSPAALPCPGDLMPLAFLHLQARGPERLDPKCQALTPYPETPETGPPGPY